MTQLDTPRSRLLGALLRCDAAAHGLRQDAVLGTDPRPRRSELVGAVRELLAAAEMLDPDSPEHWSAAGYGLPAWLYAGPHHGAGAAFELLASGEHAGRLPELVDGRGRPLLTEADLELLLDVIDRLEAAGKAGKRLLPGRIGEPDLHYVDLAAAVLGERRAALVAATVTADRRTLLPGRLTEQWEAPGPDEPVVRELLARLLRVDVPLVHDDGACAVVVGLEIELGARVDLTRPRDVRAAPRTPPRFRDGVREGHRQAIALLERLGVPEAEIEAVRVLRFRCTELGGGSEELTGGSAGLPIALHVVAIALDLVRPPWVVTGSFAGTAVVPLDGPSVRAKAAAVDAEGLWQGLAAVCAPGAAPPTVLPLTGPTLDDVCAQLWPDEWPGVRRRAAEQRLVSAGCTVQVGTAPDPLALRDAAGRVIGVTSPPHGDVLHHLRTYPTTPVVIGGPPSVGKSWTARSVAEQLEAEGWSVLVLRFRDGVLPPAKVAAGCAELALATYAPSAGGRALLVVEDLRPAPGATDLDAVLGEMAGGGRAVLAVAPADAGAQLRWKQDEVHVVATPHDTPSLAALATSLIEAHPDRFGAASGKEGLVAKASRGDRWWLVRLLEHASRLGADGTTARELRETYLRDRVGDVDDERWRAVEMLAACSLVSVWTAAAELRPLDAAALRRLGARRRLHGPTASWLLPSPAARNAILRRRGTDVEAGARAPLDGVLRALLDGDDMTEVARFLRHVSEVFDGRLLAKVAGGRGQSIVDRLVLHADAVAVARVLDLVTVLPEPARGQLFAQLVALLTHGGWPSGHVGELITCLRALREHEHLSAGARSDRALDDRWDLLLDGLAGALSRAVGAMQPHEALGLLTELDRLRRPDATRPLVTTVCIHALDHVDASRSADVFLAIRIAEIARRFSRRGRKDGERSPLDELVDTAGLRRLTAPRGTERSASDYLARLALHDQRALAGDAAPDDAEIERQLRTLLPLTPVAPLTETLRVLRRYHPGVLRHLRRVSLADLLAARLATAAPLAVAHFVAVLFRVQPRSADELLYDSGGHPRAALRADLASRITLVGDRRALSYVLEAVGDVDREFFRGRGGFGEQLVDDVRPMLEGLAGERPQVVLHLVKGLLSVDFDRRHVAALAAGLLDYVVDELRGQGTAGFEAELALVLMADEVLEGSLLAQLRARLDAGEIKRSGLLSRMRRSDTPGALTHYHNLAMALDPQLSTEFRPEASTLIGGLRDRRLPTMVDAVQAAGRTLAYAGDEGAVGELLAALEDSTEGWARRLLALRRPREVARVVNVLAALDATVVRAVLEAADTTSAGSGGLLGLLQDGRAEPDEALDMLAAVRSAHPEVGLGLVERLGDSPGWRPMRRALLEIEHPAVLGLALRRLAELGLHLEPRDVRDLGATWSHLVERMASPWTVGQLVRGVVAVDAATGRQLAHRISADRVLDRLRPVRGADGVGVSHLLLAATGGDRPDLARELVDHLAGTSLRTLSPASAVAIARAALGSPTPAGPELGRRIGDDVLIPALERRFVRDPDEHLLGIGWLARLVGRLGAAVPAARWSSSTGREHRRARLWAETWLGSTESRRAEVALLLDDVSSCLGPARPWGSAVVLVAAARSGRTRDVLGQGLDVDLARSAGSPWVAELDDAPDPDAG